MDNSKAVVIDSIEPLESKYMPKSLTLKNWFKIYISVLAMIFLLFNMVSSQSIGEAGIVIAFFLAIIFGVIMLISKVKNRENVDKAVEEINSIKFKLGESLTADEIYNKLQSESSQTYLNETTFERDDNKIIAIHDYIRYKIILNGDGTFSVIAKNSSKPDKKFYEKICTGIPIIVWGLQKSLDVK